MSASCCGTPQTSHRGRLWLGVAIVLAAIAAVLVMGCSATTCREGADAALVRSDASARIGCDVGTCLESELQQLLAEELTEDAATKIALVNNPAVRAEYERLGIARAELVQAGLLKNPVFGGNAKFFDEGTEIELTLAQPFLDLFLMPLRKRVATAEFAAAKAVVTRGLVRVAFDVRRGLVAVRGAQQVVEIRQQTLKAATASRDVMRRLHDAGNVTDPDLTVEEGAVADATLRLAAAELAVQEAREPLNVLLGLWGGHTAWRVGGRLADDPGAGKDGVESSAIASSLDLAEARARIEAAAQMAGLSPAEVALETAEIGVAAKQESTGDWGFGPAGAVSVPIFDTGAARAMKARAELRRECARQAALAIEIRSAARLFRERWAALNDRAIYVRQVLIPLRSRLVRETLQNFNAMQTGPFEVMRAKQQESDAGAEYAVALREAWTARLDLEELLAGSLNRERLGPRSDEASHGRSPQKGSGDHERQP